MYTKQFWAVNHLHKFFWNLNKQKIASTEIRVVHIVYEVKVTFLVVRVRGTVARATNSRLTFVNGCRISKMHLLRMNKTYLIAFESNKN